jgi:hypothetical protein
MYLIVIFDVKVEVFLETQMECLRLVTTDLCPIDPVVSRLNGPCWTTLRQE